MFSGKVLPKPVNRRCDVAIDSLLLPGSQSVLDFFSDVLCMTIMSISDPSQLLHRIPELEELCSDNKIAHAIATGDSFKVYRALVIARLLRRMPQHQIMLKQLTSERRLFAKPLKKTPTLGSFYTVGFSFIGESESDTDNSYIAMHALSALFVIPLIPLGAYIVKSTGDRQWQVYARAPLGLAGWIYTRSVAACMVGLVIAGAVHSQFASQHQEIILINGFNQTLTVQAAEQTVMLGAGQHQQLTLPASRLQLVAFSKNKDVIDTLNVELKSSDKTSVWNISGAAPLVKNTHTYYKVRPTQDNTGFAQIVYCGKQFIEFDNIEYLFTEPPQSVQMSKHTDSKSVEQLDIAQRQNGSEDGAHVCARYAFGNGSEKTMMPALEAIAKLSQWAEADAMPAIYTARTIDVNEAIRLATLAVRQRPDNLRLERVLQDLRNEKTEPDAIRQQLSEYAEKAKMAPDNPNAQYLYTSLLKGRTGLEASKQLHERFPQHAVILRNLIWREFIHGEYERGLQHLAGLHRLSESEAQRLSDEEIFMLLALQRPQEARIILERYLTTAEFEDKLSAATQLIQIYQLMGKDAGQAFSQLPEKLRQDPLIKDILFARVGLISQTKNLTIAHVIRVYTALREQPDKVLGLLQNMTALQLNHYFTRDQLTLMYAKACHNERADLESRLAIALNIPGTDRNKIKAYLRGEPLKTDDYDIDPALWNAVRLIRSLDANTPKNEQQALRQQVLKTDALQGVISYAAQHWQG